MQQRGREIRASQGAVKPLLRNAKFLSEATVHCLSEAAKSSEAAAKLRQFIDSAGNFGADMLKNVPGTDAGQGTGQKT